MDEIIWQITTLSIGFSFPVITVILIANGCRKIRR